MQMHGVCACVKSMSVEDFMVASILKHQCQQYFLSGVCMDVLIKRKKNYGIPQYWSERTEGGTFHIEVVEEGTVHVSDTCRS